MCGRQPPGSDTPRPVVDALARLPALESLSLAPIEAEEMLVRPLALAEGGGLRSLATLYLSGN